MDTENNEPVFLPTTYEIMCCHCEANEASLQCDQCQVICNTRVAAMTAVCRTFSVRNAQRQSTLELCVIIVWWSELRPLFYNTTTRCLSTACQEELMPCLVHPGVMLDYR